MDSVCLGLALTILVGLTKGLEALQKVCRTAQCSWIGGRFEAGQKSGPRDPGTGWIGREKSKKVCLIQIDQTEHIKPLAYKE